MLQGQVQIKIKSSLYLRYYAEARNEWRGPPPQLSIWAAQLQRNVVVVASRWRHCADLTGLGVEPQTSHSDSVHLAIELTSRLQDISTKCDCATILLSPAIPSMTYCKFERHESHQKIENIGSEKCWLVLVHFNHGRIVDPYKPILPLK